MSAIAVSWKIKMTQVGLMVLVSRRATTSIALATKTLQCEHSRMMVTIYYSCAMASFLTICTVVLPFVDMLSLRTACCCCYCGLSCDPTFSPCGVFLIILSYCVCVCVFEYDCFIRLHAMCNNVAFKCALVYS